MANPMGGGGGGDGNGGRRDDLRRVAQREPMRPQNQGRRAEDVTSRYGAAENIANQERIKATEELAKIESEINESQKARVKTAEKLDKLTRDIQEVEQDIDQQRKAGRKADEKSLQKQQDLLKKRLKTEKTLDKLRKGEEASQKKRIDAEAKERSAKDRFADRQSKTVLGRAAKAGAGHTTGFLGQQKGIVGGVATAVREAAEHRQLKALAAAGSEDAAKALKARSGGGGALGAIGSAIGGGGGGASGAIGNILGAAASGGTPWGMALKGGMQTIKELGGVALEADDKMARLAGRYIKATNQIPESTEAATTAVAKNANMFRNAYVDVLDEAKKFGVSHTEVFDNVNQLIKSVRPTGDQAMKSFKDLSKASFQFAAALDLDQATVTEAIEDNMLRMGKTAEQTQSDLGEVYSVVTAANKELQDQLGGANIRMDAFAKIIFESARNADLWSLNYRAVAKELAGLEALATKAGVSEQRRQKIAKGILAYQLEANKTPLAYLSAQRLVGEQGIAAKGRSTEDIMKEILDTNKGMSQEMISDIKGVLEKRGSYESEEVFAQALQNAMAGTQQAMKARTDTLKNMMSGMGEAGKETMLAQIEGFSELSQQERRAALKVLEAGGDMEDIQKKLGKEIKGGMPGGAGRTEMYSKGMMSSLGNMWETEKEMLAQQVLGNKLLLLVAKATGENTDTLEEELNAMDRQLKTDKANKQAVIEGKASAEMAELAQKGGIDVTAKGSEKFKTEMSLADYLKSDKFLNLSRQDPEKAKRVLMQLYGVSDEGTAARMQGQARKEAAQRQAAAQPPTLSGDIGALLSTAGSDEERIEMLSKVQGFENYTQDQLREYLQQTGHTEMPRPQPPPAAPPMERAAAISTPAAAAPAFNFSDAQANMSVDEHGNVSGTMSVPITGGNVKIADKAVANGQLKAANP